MRVLLLLPWCFLLSLAVDEPVKCNWKTPEELQALAELLPPSDPPKPPIRECTQIIEWKYRDEKQAKATCLEYFPTTFVEGKRGDDDSKIECTVYSQFECKHIKDSKSMFDKCYTFSKPDEVTMAHYLDKTKRKEFCDGDKGGIPVFLTMTQAKHIAGEAHRQNIFKMWVNVNKNGQTIEKSGSFEKEAMLYKEQWKVNKDYYWVGDKLEKIDKAHKDKDGNPIIESLEKDKTIKLDYLFFRTRTDYVHNLMQGSFERATENTKATVVCEYPAKTIPDQKKYCGKMQELNLNAFYDESRGRKRCVYTSLTAYSLVGTKEAIRDFPGCREKPSEQHSSGLDDGTAEAKENGKSLYNKLTASGTYRVAVIKMNTKTGQSSSDANYAQHVRQHCDARSFSADVMQKHRQPYKTYDHFQKEGYTNMMTTDWDDSYPKDECSDFPSPSMDSTALAINKGKIIDVPVPVRFPAICSISSNVDCELNKQLCADEKNSDGGRAEMICVNTNTWIEKNKLYAKCDCPPFHMYYEAKKVCAWLNKPDAWEDKQLPAKSCGQIRQFSTNLWAHLPIGSLWTLWDNWNDYVDRVVVRNGCTMTVWAHPQNAGIPNVALLKDLKVGEYVIPNHEAGTLNGWGSGMSASAIECSCAANAPIIDPPP